MADIPILSQLPLLPEDRWPPKKAENKPNLHTYWQQLHRLPTGAGDNPTIQRYLDLLGPLDWGRFPERDLKRDWGQPQIPYAALAAAELIRLEQGLRSAADLSLCLREHPGFIPLLGFPLVPAPNHPLGFNARASLPTTRHVNRMLRRMPNAAARFLLADTVRLILAELAARQVPPPQCISLDTKHILAWVKENNRKAYVKERYTKTRQPAGDPDCRLGCKRRRNQGPPDGTPTRNPVPATGRKVGEFYWGYASGTVVAKVPSLGEFVVAELTQPFDRADQTYFFPLMRQAEAHLGYRPLFGALDAAFDAWYVYAYFCRDSDPAHGMAAVPFVAKGGYAEGGRQFAPDGLPLCRAGLPMQLHMTFTDRTTCLIEHERGTYVCPLADGVHRRLPCPIRCAKAKHGGCTAMMPTSIGARLRYQLDRQSELYKSIYRQRTADERINSQALALGIERPHLRNGAAIANQNTLIYTLINLRFLRRLRQANALSPSAA
jgi:hypothetical protein